MKHLVNSVFEPHAPPCDLVHSLGTSFRVRPDGTTNATSFNEYQHKDFGALEMKEANLELTEEKDGRIVVIRAKDTEGGGLMPAVPPVYKKRKNSGNNMPKETKWEENKADQDEPEPSKQPPIGLADMWKFVAHRNMIRAKEASIICDNALLEVHKQQAAAKYHSQQALMYEAAALRSLRHGGKAAGRSVEPPLKLKINEYPVPPDAQWSSSNLSSPPGWEAPGAAQVPLYGPSPMNSFRISSEQMIASSAPWWIACVARYNCEASGAQTAKSKSPSHLLLASFL